jgi:integrase
MKLTDAAIRKAKAAEKPRKLADAGGLYIEIHPNGSKYWRLKYRFAGKEKRLALGVYPTIGLAAARAFREDAKKLLANGMDPGEVKKSKKQASRQGKANRHFETVAREWHARKASTWSAGHAKHILASLESDVFPYIGTTPIEEVQAMDVINLVRRVEDRGSPDIARRVWRRVRAILSYAKAMAMIPDNPAADIEDALPDQPKGGHFPTIENPKHIPAFLTALADYWQKANVYPMVRIATRMLAYTFVRTGELRGARWVEFDMEERLWTVPADRMKSGAPHLVPLSRQVVDLLQELRPYSGTSPLLFPGRLHIDQPISDNTINMAIKRAGYAGRMCGHGFRSMASTYLNGLGTIRPDMIEAQLAHKDRDKVRAAYNRASYMEYRVAMMQFWADTLDAMEAGRPWPQWKDYALAGDHYRSAEVVRMPGKKAG